MDIATIIVTVLAVVAFVTLSLMIKSVLKLRRVVPPTEVHIVQSEKSGRMTYGSRKAGEEQVKATTYYAWPTWIPQLGVQVSSAAADRVRPEPEETTKRTTRNASRS
jgi:hypothetical protein